MAWKDWNRYLHRQEEQIRRIDKSAEVVFDILDKDNGKGITSHGYEVNINECNLLQSVTETDNAEVRKVLLVKLEKLSEQKAQAEQMLKSITCPRKELPTKAVLKELLQQAKRQFRKGTLQETKKLIDVFVDRVTIGMDEVELKLYLMPPVTEQNIPVKLCQEVVTIDRNKLKNIRNKVS